MNPKTKKNIKKAVNSSHDFFGNCMLMIVSLFRIILLSSWKSSIKCGHKNLAQHKEACILGNGPSLKEDFENNTIQTDKQDIFCVNMFCLSEYFWKLKPRFYTLVDPQLFEPTSERTQQLVKELANCLNKVDWPMFLVISSYQPNNGLLSLLHNSYIDIIRKNNTEAVGFCRFRHWVYRQNLGMPQCQNVLNFAIMTAVNMQYQTINIYGADHSWTKDLRVDEENNVCYGDRHVYNTNMTVIKKKESISLILRAFANMFESHQMIAKYAETTKTQLINKTKGSFIDAYAKE